MTRPVRTTLDGTVTHVHDLGRVVVVQITTATGHPAIVILADHQSARSAARRYQPGRHITATGIAPPDHPGDHIPVIRATRIRSTRPPTPAELTNRHGIPLDKFLAQHGATHLLATPTTEPPSA
jgi:hypothetical protein